MSTLAARSTHVPRIGLAEPAGLLIDNGVVVSDKLQTSERHMRVEHWANALNQPSTAARAMLGKPASYDRHPSFFSDQYDVGMEFTGDPSGTDEDAIKSPIEAATPVDKRMLLDTDVGLAQVAERAGAAPAAAVEGA